MDFTLSPDQERILGAILKRRERFGGSYWLSGDGTARARATGVRRARPDA